MSNCGLRGLGVGLRVRGDRDVEVRDPAKPCHQIDGVGVAAGMRRVPGVGFRRVAAKGHDVADSGLVVRTGHLVHLLARGADAGEMRRGGERGLPEDPMHGRVGTVAGAAPPPRR